MVITISIKKFVAIAAVFAILGLAYYTNYLPLQKSRAFIGALRGQGGARSLQEFEDNFNKVLAMPSPIGQEELVRNTGNSVMGVIQHSPRGSPLVPAMVSFMERHYLPIVETNRGMSYSQNLYLLGNMYENAYFKTGNLDYLAKAEQNFTSGLERGPNRPQFLYGAFDVYRLKGDVENATTIVERILANWPSDQKARDAHAQFLADVERGRAEAAAE